MAAATSLPAASGGVKGKRSVYSGRRGTKPLSAEDIRREPQTGERGTKALRRQGHSPGTATGVGFADYFNKSPKAIPPLFTK